MKTNVSTPCTFAGRWAYMWCLYVLLRGCGNGPFGSSILPPLLCCCPADDGYAVCAPRYALHRRSLFPTLTPAEFRQSTEWVLLPACPSRVDARQKNKEYLLSFLRALAPPLTVVVRILVLCRLCLDFVFFLLFRESGCLKEKK